MNTKLEVKAVSVDFDGKKIIEDINIHLNEGEIVCLLGISGSGKTTLFNVISGLLSPDEGNVYLNGNDITNKAGNVSYMLQKDMLLPFKTVVDNVALPLVIRGKHRREARKEAMEHFEEFGLKGTEKKYPSQLSGGMKQRAALLRTYMFSKEVALLDEPFSALDTITKSAMHEWYLDVMQKIKMSTIFITHDIDEAIKLSDRIYVMTGHPGIIINEIEINESKPRDKNFIVSDEFIDYKKQILSILENS